MNQIFGVFIFLLYFCIKLNKISNNIIKIKIIMKLSNLFKIGCLAAALVVNPINSDAITRHHVFTISMEPCGYIKDFNPLESPNPHRSVAQGTVTFNYDETFDLSWLKFATSMKDVEIKTIENGALVDDQKLADVLPGEKINVPVYADSDYKIEVYVGGELAYTADLSL
jgi:hypothetical protein